MQRAQQKTFSAVIDVGWIDLISLQKEKHSLIRALYTLDTANALTFTT